MTDNMTPMMELWLADADEMGLEKDMQKGMLFCLGFALCLNSKQADRDVMQMAIRQLSTEAMDRKGYGDQLNDQALRSLLIELVMKADPNTEPSVLHTTEDGDQMMCFDPTDRSNCLPDVDPDSTAAGDWDKLMVALYRNIGAELDLDAEDCYLAGIDRGVVYACSDFDTAFMIARLLDRMKAPYATWLCTLPYLGEEWIEPAQNDTLMHKILYAKQLDAQGQLPISVDLSMQVFRYLERRTVKINYALLGLEQPEAEEHQTNIRAIELESIAFLAALVQVPVSMTFTEELGEAERQMLLEIGFQAPPRGMNKDEVMHWMMDGITKRYGYDMAELQPAEAWQCTYRACAISYYAMACLLEPGWNDSCLNAHAVKSIEKPDGQDCSL